MSDLDAVKLDVGLLVAVVVVEMVRGVHACFASNLMTHSHTHTEAFQQHARVMLQGSVLGM